MAECKVFEGRFFGDYPYWAVTLSLEKNQHYETFINGDEMGLEYSGLTYKTSRGFSQSQSNSTSGTGTITYTDSDDPLGTFIVQYCDQVTTGASRSAVQLHSYNIGKVECIILPRHAN